MSLSILSNPDGTITIGCAGGGGGGGGGGGLGIGAGGGGPQPVVIKPKDSPLGGCGASHRVATLRWCTSAT